MNNLQAADFNQVAKSGTIVVIEAIAVGTFVYVTFLEVWCYLFPPTTFISHVF